MLERIRVAVREIMQALMYHLALRTGGHTTRFVARDADGHKA